MKPVYIHLGRKADGGRDSTEETRLCMGTTVSRLPRLSTVLVLPRTAKHKPSVKRHKTLLVKHKDISRNIFFLFKDDLNTEWSERKWMRKSEWEKEIERENNKKSCDQQWTRTPFSDDFFFWFVWFGLVWLVFNAPVFSKSKARSENGARVQRIGPGSWHIHSIDPLSEQEITNRNPWLRWAPIRMRWMMRSKRRVASTTDRYQRLVEWRKNHDSVAANVASV